MNATYTALIALMRSGEISMEPGESLPASSAQFSVRIRPESRVFLDRCAEHLGISRAALFGLCIDGILAEVYSAAKHLIPICISFDTDKK